MSGPERTGTPLGRLLAPIRRRLVLACVLRGVGAVAGVVPFVAVAELARALLRDPVDEGRAWSIAWVAVGALGVHLASTTASAGILHLADADLQLEVRRGIVRRLGAVPLGWFDRRRSGEIRKAVQDDVDELHHLVAHWFPDLTAAVVTPVVSVAYLLAVDWRLTLVTLVPAVTGAVVVARMLSGTEERTAAFESALGRVGSAVVELVDGIAVVKAFGAGRRAHRRFSDEADAFADAFWAWARPLAGPSSVAEIILSAPVALLTVLTGGTAMVGAGWIEPLDVLPFALLGLGITAPFLTLSHSDEQLDAARQAAQRIDDLLTAPVLPRPAGSGAQPVDGHVTFASVSFSYDGVHDVLDGIDLDLRPGSVTALVGPSGAGKTTIARLLLRFWDPTAGTITLGGVDLRLLQPDQLYRHVGFVLQDVQLLRTTIRDNIRLGDPDATADRVEAAARRAQIHERIVRLPRGYDSEVGVDAHLSGGEAQRVSIARALLVDPPVLVLDEATSFADPESEAAIQDALSALVAGRTLLVIAHRLHTVAGADQIVVVDGGRVVERGTHDELVTSGGRYSALWAAEAGARHRSGGAAEEVRSCSAGS